jgi:hypothetical protein
MTEFALKFKCGPPFLEFPRSISPFQVFSMFSVHPKIKNLSFYQVKTHKWLEKTQQFILSLMKYFPSNKAFYHDHFNLSCTTLICHCSLALSSLFCIHVTECLMNILYFVFSEVRSRSKLHTERTSQVFVECVLFYFP